MAIAVLGTSVPLLIDSASFFVLVVALLYIKNVPSIPPLATAGWLEQFTEGIIFFRRRRGLIWLAAVVAGVNFGLAGFWNIYLLIFAKDHLMVGSLGWGSLNAMSAAGIFISSIIMARAGNVKHRRRFVTIPIVSLGLSMITFSLTNTLLASLLAIFTLGFSIPFFDVVIVTFYQEVVPTHLMGRVFGVRRFINYALIPPGVIFGGFAVVYFGAAKAIFISGAVVLFLGVATIFLKSLSILDEPGKA